MGRKLIVFASIIVLISVFFLGNSTCTTPVTEYTLTIYSTEGGSVTTHKEETLYPYDEGERVPLEATPDSGYQFSHWIGDVYTIDNPDAFRTDILMDSDIILTAVFERSSIDLLIITPDQFKDILLPLKTHKNKTGIATEIIVLSEVYKQYNGRDEAEKVKYCLADYRVNKGMRFAMLVGDSDQFPVRYHKSDTAFYATDLYYADLFKFLDGGGMDNWDKNNNGYFGEIQGSLVAGIINVDDVDLRPDIAVGRIPASTSKEVQIYVNKVIEYENGGYQPKLFKRALLIATTDLLNDACKYQDEIASKSLTKFKKYKLYSAGNPCSNVTVPSANAINFRMNIGVGFVSYIGHGTRTYWEENYWPLYSIGDISGLNNADRLPVVFSIGCSTSEFTTQAPYEGYTDINGVNHTGTNNGEVFKSTPPQPACIQTIQNPESLGEALTVQHKTGAIGYIGCVTGSQGIAVYLNKFFFEAYRYGHEFLGCMWNYAIQRYYETHVVPAAISTPDWKKVATFHQPWKFILFGDPSLRIGGVRPSLDEDCLPFDYNNIKLTGAFGNWSIIAPGSALFINFRYDDLASAYKAYDIIQHYKFTSMCFVGDPKTMTYFLSNGKAPIGPFPGEKSIFFNPSAITVKKINNKWRLVEGPIWLMDLGSSEAEALKAFAIIQKYGFNQICSVGAPKPRMQYFRR